MSTVSGILLGQVSGKISIHSTIAVVEAPEDQAFYIFAILLALLAYGDIYGRVWD
jgi:hypothetical protein